MNAAIIPGRARVGYDVITVSVSASDDEGRLVWRGIVQFEACFFPAWDGSWDEPGNGDYWEFAQLVEVTAGFVDPTDFAVDWLDNNSEWLARARADAVFDMRVGAAP